MSIPPVITTDDFDLDDIVPFVEGMCCEHYLQLMDNSMPDELFNSLLIEFIKQKRENARFWASSSYANQSL